MEQVALSSMIGLMSQCLVSTSKCPHNLNIVIVAIVYRKVPVFYISESDLNDQPPDVRMFTHFK